MKSEEFVKKDEIVSPNRRVRPLGRRKNRVKEYMSERGPTTEGGLGQAGRECLDRERLKLFCCGHPLGGCSQMK